MREKSISINDNSNKDNNKRSGKRKSKYSFIRLDSFINEQSDNRRNKHRTKQKDAPNENEPSSIMQYNGIPLIRSEYDTMRELEKTFAQKIRHLQHDTVSNHARYYFTSKNNHVISLNLTQITLKKLYKAQILPDSIGDLLHLEHLEIKISKISSLPDSFRKLVNLKSLDLSYNQFSQFPDQINSLIKLKSLNLSNNSLNSIPSSLSHLKQLRSIDLSKNQFSHIDSSKLPSENLEVLNLSSNQIESFPQHLDNFKVLKILDLQENNIKNAKDDYTFPATLKHLYLKSNPICLDFNTGNIPPFIQTLSLKSWIHFKSHIPRSYFSNFPLEYCPTHETRLKPIIEELNKRYGWKNYRYSCGAENCTYKCDIPSEYQKKIWQNLREKYSSRVSGKEKNSKIFYEKESCPPHDIHYHDLNGRWVGRCSKCNKNEEEILNL